MVYRPMIQMKTRTLLTWLLANPGEWEAHIERFVVCSIKTTNMPKHCIRQIFRLQGELVMAITYGYEVKGNYDRKLDAARELSTLTSKSALPGALLVNELPLRE